MGCTLTRTGSLTAVAHCALKKTLRDGFTQTRKRPRSVVVADATIRPFRLMMFTVSPPVLGAM